MRIKKKKKNNREFPIKKLLRISKNKKKLNQKNLWKIQKEPKKNKKVQKIMKKTIALINGISIV